MEVVLISAVLWRLSNIKLILIKNSQTSFNSLLIAVRSETSSPKFDLYNHWCFDTLAKSFVARDYQILTSLPLMFLWT